MVSELMVKTGSDECNMVLVSKVFLARIQSKHVPLRTTVQKKAEKEYSWLGINEKVEHYINNKDP